MPGDERQWVRLKSLLAFASGIAFLFVILVLAVVIPEPTPFRYLVFRIVLALAAGAFGAIIPGLIFARMSPFSWASIRAGGAMAMFAVVFFCNPAALLSNASMGQSPGAPPDTKGKPNPGKSGRGQPSPTIKGIARPEDMRELRDFREIGAADKDGPFVDDQQVKDLNNGQVMDVHIHNPTDITFDLVRIDVAVKKSAADRDEGRLYYYWDRPVPANTAETIRLLISPKAGAYGFVTLDWHMAYVRK